MNRSANCTPADSDGAEPDQNLEDCYEVHLDGWLNDCWSEWLDGMKIRHEGEYKTIITGPVIDQSALYGLLLKIRDLNLKLLLVKKLYRAEAQQFCRIKSQSNFKKSTP